MKDTINAIIESAAAFVFGYFAYGVVVDVLENPIWLGMVCGAIIGAFAGAAVWDLLND